MIDSTFVERWIDIVRDREIVLIMMSPTSRNKRNIWRACIFDFTLIWISYRWRSKSPTILRILLCESKLFHPIVEKRNRRVEKNLRRTPTSQAMNALVAFLLSIQILALFDGKSMLNNFSFIYEYITKVWVDVKLL